MDKPKLRDRKWYPYAVAACIAVLLYVLLIRLPDVRKGIGKFIGYFRPVILGCVIAYIVNPLATLLSETMFRFIKKEKNRYTISCIVAFILVAALLVFSLMILIPQLISSIGTFIGNLDSYVESLGTWLEKIGLSKDLLDLDSLIGSSKVEDTTKTIMESASTVLSKSMSAGRGIARWLIAFMLAIYLLLAKGSLTKGAGRLIKAIFGEEKYAEITVFLTKSNDVFKRYIVFNLIDSAIIGALNFIFMMIMGMEYAGLITFVVALTNLIPTFGPLIGGAFGAFILLLVKPIHVLFFLGFTLLLQFLDAYFIKPKLFGDSLGVSGLWILIGVIVGGNMFGIVGILLSIPMVAILSFLYSRYLLPWLEKRHGITQTDSDVKGD